MIKIDKDSFVIADTHYGHKNIVKYESIRQEELDRIGANDIDKLMTANWNKTVSAEQTIFHLGDLAFRHNGLEDLVKPLSGKKILLVGNHDKHSDIKILKEAGWGIIEDVVVNVEGKDLQGMTDSIVKKHRLGQKEKRLLCCYISDIEGKRVLFSHFPLYDDNPYDEKYRPIVAVLEELFEELACDINVHGHTHSKETKSNKCISACVELNEFKPIRLEELLKK